MLEKGKKVLIDILLKLKILKHKDDKNEEDLTEFFLFIELLIGISIANWLKDIVSETWNLDFHHNFFISFTTLLIPWLLVSYPVRFVLRRINRFYHFIRDKQH